VLYLSAALASGAGTALFGVIGGRIAQKFGFTDPDLLLAKIGSKTTQQNIAKRIAGSFVSEGVFEELPQGVQEQMWLNAALDKPIMEGVPESAAQGLVVGGAKGGAFGIAKPHQQVNHTQDIAKTETPAQAVPESPVQSPNIQTVRKDEFEFTPSKDIDRSQATPYSIPSTQPENLRKYENPTASKLTIPSVQPQTFEGKVQVAQAQVD